MSSQAICAAAAPRRRLVHHHRTRIRNTNNAPPRVGGILLGQEAGHVKRKNAVACLVRGADRGDGQHGRYLRPLCRDG
jgi:hypothetical protein